MDTSGVVIALHTLGARIAALEVEKQQLLEELERRDREQETLTAENHRLTLALADAAHAPTG